MSERFCCKRLKLRNKRGNRITYHGNILPNYELTKTRKHRTNNLPRAPHSAPHFTGKNNGFPFLDILGYLKNTPQNPKFGKVRQVPTREFPTKFPGWDLSHSSKFGIFVGILIQKWESVIFPVILSWLCRSSLWSRRRLSWSNLGFSSSR